MWCADVLFKIIGKELVVDSLFVVHTLIVSQVNIAAPNVNDDGGVIPLEVRTAGGGGFLGSRDVVGAAGGVVVDVTESWCGLDAIITVVNLDDAGHNNNLNSQVAKCYEPPHNKHCKSSTIFNTLLIIHVHNITRASMRNTCRYCKRSHGGDSFHDTNGNEGVIWELLVTEGVDEHHAHTRSCQQYRKDGGCQNSVVHSREVIHAGLSGPHIFQKALDAETCSFPRTRNGDGCES